MKETLGGKYDLKFEPVPESTSNTITGDDYKHVWYVYGKETC